MVGLLMGIPLGRITKKSHKNHAGVADNPEKNLGNRRQTSKITQKWRRTNIKQHKKKGREGGLTSASSHYSTPLGKANFSVVPLGYTTRNSAIVNGLVMHLQRYGNQRPVDSPKNLSILFYIMLRRCPKSLLQC